MAFDISKLIGRKIFIHSFLKKGQWVDEQIPQSYGTVESINEDIATIIDTTYTFTSYNDSISDDITFYIDKDATSLLYTMNERNIFINQMFFTLSITANWEFHIYKNIDPDLIFYSDEERDAYFVTNPDELVEGLKIRNYDHIEQYTNLSWITIDPNNWNDYVCNSMTLYMVNHGTVNVNISTIATSTTYMSYINFGLAYPRTETLYWDVNVNDADAIYKVSFICNMEYLDSSNNIVKNGDPIVPSISGYYGDNDPIMISVYEVVTS